MGFLTDWLTDWLKSLLIEGIPQDRIIIVDPMGEYAPLVRRLGGQVIEIAPDSPHHLNPMDVELNMAAGESPLSMKADFLLSLCELVVGGKEGLQPIEKTVVDRCVRLVYREQALGLDTGKTPLLQDLYEELLKQPEPEARRVATALELYCTGSLNLFNHPTNVKTDSRVVCIVLKNMGENLRKIAMHITNEFVSQAVDTNFREGVATWCYFDEFHVLLRDPLTASYFVAVWKIRQRRFARPSPNISRLRQITIFTPPPKNTRSSPKMRCPGSGRKSGSASNIKNGRRRPRNKGRGPLKKLPLPRKSWRFGPWALSNAIPWGVCWLWPVFCWYW